MCGSLAVLLYAALVGCTQGEVKAYEPTLNSLSELDARGIEYETVARTPLSEADKEEVLTLIRVVDPSVGPNRPEDLLIGDAVWACEHFGVFGVEAGLDGLIESIELTGAGQRILDYYGAMAAVSVMTVCPEHEAEFKRLAEANQ